MHVWSNCSREICINQWGEASWRRAWKTTVKKLCLLQMFHYTIIPCREKLHFVSHCTPSAWPCISVKKCLLNKLTIELIQIKWLVLSLSQYWAWKLMQMNNVPTKLKQHPPPRPVDSLSVLVNRDKLRFSPQCYNYNSSQVVGKMKRNGFNYIASTWICVWVCNINRNNSSCSGMNYYPCIWIFVSFVLFGMYFSFGKLLLFHYKHWL